MTRAKAAVLSALAVSAFALTAGAAPVAAEPAVQAVSPLFKVQIDDCARLPFGPGLDDPERVTVFEMDGDLARYQGQCALLPSVSVQLQMEDASGLDADEGRKALFVKVAPDLVTLGLWDDVRYPDLRSGVPLDFSFSEWGA